MFAIPNYCVIAIKGVNEINPPGMSEFCAPRGIWMTESLAPLSREMEGYRKHR